MSLFAFLNIMKFLLSQSGGFTLDFGSHILEKGYKFPLNCISLVEKLQLSWFLYKHGSKRIFQTCHCFLRPSIFNSKKQCFQISRALTSRKCINKAQTKNFLIWKTPIWYHCSSKKKTTCKTMTRVPLQLSHVLSLLIPVQQKKSF